MAMVAVRGLDAYNQVLQNNKQITPSKDQLALQPTMVLRHGDNLEILASEATNKPSFEKFLDQAVYSEVAKIKNSGKKVNEFLNLNPSEEVGAGVDLVGLVASVNASEMALQTLVSVREKLINAYQDIMKMPL